MGLYKRLLGYFLPHMRQFLLSSVFMILVSASAGSAALIIKPILDDIFIRKDVTMLRLLPAAVVGIYLLRAVARYYSSFLMQIIGQLVIQRIRNELFQHVQKLSLRFFSHQSTGRLMSRITNDVQTIQDSVSIVLYDLVRELLTVLTLLGVIFYRDFRLAMISLLLLPFSTLLVAKLGTKLRIVSRIRQDRMAGLSAILQESISGVRVVQAFGMERYEVGRFLRENETYYDAMKKAIRYNEMASPLLEFIGAFGIAAVVWYGGLQVIEGKTTVGSFFSFMTALFMLFAPISKLARANNKVQQALGASQRIFELMDEPVEIRDRPGAGELGPLKDRIEYRDVSFRYDAEMVLNHVHLTIPKGSITALVGLSGAGKTTFADLIPRFYDVTEGAILVDGVDIRDVTVSSLRRHIGIVTQEVFLFNDTVRNNICYGRSESGDEEMICAARTAYAHDFISNFPQGYETPIGERGVKLSGGERQRLSIARAILKNPEILILDEATSSLDSESEAIVQKALNNLMENRTTVVIAHRLSTIINADRIVVLDSGTIAETGTHRELLAGGSLYKKIYQLQFEGGRE